MRYDIGRGLFEHETGTSLQTKSVFQKSTFIRKTLKQNQQLVKAVDTIKRKAAEVSRERKKRNIFVALETGLKPLSTVVTAICQRVHLFSKKRVQLHLS